MEEEQEIRLIIYGLGILGALIFLGALTHDLFGLEYENPKLGMVDIFIALMGVTLLIPSLLLVFSLRPAILVLGILGIMMFFAAFHDLVGLNIGPYVLIGKIDLFVSMLGILLLIPCILFMFSQEEEKVVYLGILGVIFFFGALFHESLNFGLSKHPGIGPLDRIASFLGVVSMSLYFIIRLRLKESHTKVLFFIGLFIFLSALFHDFVGFHFSENTHIGLLDSLFAFWGLTLYFPYQIALAEKEEKRYHLRKR
ncbi:hypothetical protein ACFLRC_01180 [Candidatus Altiarchaeota archaeon]